MVSEFYHMKIEEKELRKLFKTSTEGGTNWLDVINGMKELGIEFVYMKNQSLDKLKELIKRNIPVVVSVDTRKLGDFGHRQHTIVVIDVSENNIEVNDPEKGPNTQLLTNEFLEAWKNRLYRMGYIEGK